MIKLRKNITNFSSEVSRSDWMRRWLYSTNAKDILRHRDLFCYINIHRIVVLLNDILIYPVGDLENIEKQDGLVKPGILNVVYKGVLTNRIVKLGMKKKFYETCRRFKHITWAKANHCMKTGSLARRFFIPKLLKHLIGIFIDVVNRRSPYVSIPVQMTSYTLCIENKLLILKWKSRKYENSNKNILHNQNRFNVVTSERDLNTCNEINRLKEDLAKLSIKNLNCITKNVFKSSVVILCNKSIKLFQWNETLNKQSLALYLNQFIYRQNGGRITDQAKASSKSDDSGINKYIFIKHHSLFVMTRRPLNSVLLKSTYNNLTVRNLSYYTREKINPFRKDKIKNELLWPEKWQIIEKKVRNRQMKLCMLAEKYNKTNKNKIVNYQRKLALDLDFRLLAVRTVTSNKGKNTPGTDGKLIKNKEEKCQMVEKLKYWIINPKKYKAKPVKRVYIPKNSNKLRPLGIPNIEDRCLQALLNLVLEPLIEMNSDTHSYGFRKYRSAKMALGALRVNLRSTTDHYDKYVLDADIEGFFDNISHDWLLKEIPLEITLKIILRKWLKAGAIYLEKLEPTTTGTPQGGIISPCLANFTLNGLQEYIRQAVLNKYKGFSDGSFNVRYRKDGKIKYNNLRLKIFTVRYADDFLVLGRSRKMIETAVVPAVQDFLRERGLNLSKEKSKILSVRKSDKIPFLGYSFQYLKKFSPKYNMFNERLNKEGISCYPNKENYVKIVKELRDVFRKNINDSAYTLISKLNPKIRGWANYFNMSQSYYIRNRLNYVLYRFVWIWARRKHPKWGKKKIAKYYFLKPKGLKKINEIEFSSYYTGNHKKWIFRGFTKNPSIYNDFEKGKYIELIDPSLIIETISARRYRIPKELETVHAYHPDYEKLIQSNLSMAFNSVKNTKILKVKLLKKQKGRCAMCKRYLIDTENVIPLDGEWHIHHIVKRSEGGSKKSKENLQLVHSDCHISHHKEE